MSMFVRQFPFHAIVARLLPLILVLTPTAVLLFNALRTPPPWTLDLGTADDTQFVAGFRIPVQEDATTFRWSTPDAQLMIPSIAGNRVHMRLHGDHIAVSNNHRLHLKRDGVTRTTLEIQTGWRVYQVLLPELPAATAARGVTPITLVSTAYNTSATEERAPGVPIDWIKVMPLTGVGTPITVPLRQALMMVWGLTILFCLVEQLIRSLRCQMEKVSVVLWTSGVISVVASGLLFWSAHDPYTLLWAWPAPPWVLLLATLFLLAIMMQRSKARSAQHNTRSERMLKLSTIGYRLPIIGLWLLAHLILFLPISPALRGLAALFILGLPGSLLALLLFWHERDLLVRLLIGLCGGIALFPMLLLALQALPGPVAWWMLLLPCDALSLWLGWSLLQKASTVTAQPNNSQRHAYVPLVILLLLGGFLRFTFLGVSELEEDETKAVLRTMGVVHGREEILLQHKKGPIEVLLPAGPLALTGQLTEGIARMPFALAGMGILVGSYLLGQTLLRDKPDISGFSTVSVLNNRGTQVGFIAATILTIDGFLIGFARIVQYQSIVMLMMIGSLWCGWRFYTGGPYSQRYLIGAAIMITIGLLAHYDGIFVVPALTWLVVAGGRRRGWRGGQWLRALGGVILVGGGGLSSFYLPFVLHEHFRNTTLFYLSWRLDQQAGVATELLFNNLDDYYALATFYNTVFQTHWLALMLMAGILIWLWQYVYSRVVRGVLLCFLLTGCTILLWNPAHFTWAGVNWAGMFFALPLAGLVLAPATPAGLRALLIWFSAAFLAESFVIAVPRTHFYTMLVAAALLIGLTIAEILAWLRMQGLIWLQTLLVCSGIAVLLLAMPYAYLAFVRLTPEYTRGGIFVRPEIYHTSYSSASPSWDDYFGFPQRDGWKVIGTLYRFGILQGDYDTNQKDVISTWYTQGAFRCGATPDYFFAALREEGVDNHIQMKIWQGYQLFGYVLVDGVRTLDIYSQHPVPQSPQVFTLDTYRQFVDKYPIKSFPIQRTLFIDAPQYQFHQDWQQAVQLRGYDLLQQKIAPGQSVVVTLYWKASQEIATNYVPFVEVLDSNGNKVGSAELYCHTDFSNWSLQVPMGTPFKLTADTAMPPGTYTLQVGLHHIDTGMLLPLRDGTSTLPFATVIVKNSD